MATEAWRVTVGSLTFHLQRDGDMVIFRSGLVRQYLSRAEIRELQTDLEQVLGEMFRDELDLDNNSEL